MEVYGVPESLEPKPHRKPRYKDNYARPNTWTLFGLFGGFQGLPGFGDFRAPGLINALPYVMWAIRGQFLRTRKTEPKPRTDLWSLCSMEFAFCS